MCYNQDRPRPLRWMGSSLSDLRRFPEDVKAEVGYALQQVQLGSTPRNAKPLRGYRGVFEIVCDFDRDTYRAVYSVKIAGTIYVLHAFKKKSKKGIATPQADLAVISARLKAAERLSKESWRMEDTACTDSSGNVFEDLQLPDAAERSLKARLAGHVNALIDERNLTQRVAAEILGVTQPDVSDLQRGRLRRFSVERLLKFLTALDRKIEITIRPAQNTAQEESIAVLLHR